MPPFSRAGGAGDGEEGVREHREGHMSVPAVVAADLVVVQAHFSLACLEGFLDGPPFPGDRDQGGQGGSDRG